MNITLDEIRSKAPDGATHYAEDFEEGLIYLEARSYGYVWPYSGLLISDYDLHGLTIKPL